MRRIKSFGGQHETLPIKDQKQLQNFLYYFLIKKDKAKTKVKRDQAYRNYMLCLVGFNTAFRAEDLLQLRVTDVLKGYVSIKENKTGKMQHFRMNKKLHSQIKEYINYMELSEYDYMFMGQKRVIDGKVNIYPITRQQGHRIVSKAATAVGIDFTFGLHSLRKTFGYMYVKNDGKINTLMKMYNHDDPNVTMLYICWGIDDAQNDREAMYLGI